MKQVVKRLLWTCLIWSGWCLGLRAEELPVIPVMPAEKPLQLSWPEKPLSTAELDANCSNLSERDPFRPGNCTYQFMVGYFPSTSVGPGGPAFDYLPIAVRFGYMLTDTICDKTCLRGNFETLLEVNYAPVLREFGSYVTGPNLILRYNYLQPDWIIVPYLQGGAGLAFTDAYKTPGMNVLGPGTGQDLIGQELEFLLRAEIGARLMITECVSFDAEFGFQHISNATLAPRNGGVNNIGFAIGFTYFFGKIK